MRVFLFLCIFGVIASDMAPLTLFSSSQFPNARCLDGSSSGFYYQVSSTSNNNWMFVLEGGGLCSHQDDCTSRAKTHLGSSSSWAQNFDMDTYALLTADPKNPFANWNKVFVPYCDGGMWSGSRSVATNETFGLYFSGHLTIEALITHLNQTTKIGQDDSLVVFSGGSAGGIGAFMNYEYVGDMLPKATVLGAPVGGFPPEIQWFLGANHTTPQEDVHDDQFSRLAALYDSFTPQSCRNNVPPSLQSTCFIPRLAYPYFQRPVFIIEALTDVVILIGFEGVPKTLLQANDAIAFMNQYGLNQTQNMQQVLRSDRDGCFAPSCWIHCSFFLNQPIIDGDSAISALYRWVQARSQVPLPSLSSSLNSRPRLGDNEFMWIDTCPNNTYFPTCNPTCPPPAASALEQSLKGLSVGMF